MSFTHRTEKLGELAATVVEETDIEPHDDAPTVVLCHGFGAPGTDLVDLATVLRAPSGTRFVFPAAHLRVRELGSEARAWWWVDIASLGAAIARGELASLYATDPPGLSTARGLLLDALAAVRRRWTLSPNQIVLGGFSQGAILASDVAYRSDMPLGGLVQWSGMLFVQDEWSRGMERRRGLPVVQSHGTFDPILPYRGAERLRDLQLAAGLDLRWRSFAGAHGIAPEAILAVSELLTEISVRSSPASAARPTDSSRST